MDSVDICIVGAGVVGLAIARELVSLSDQLVILEKESTFGQGISSRNSEVIHAGIYYAQNSLKAELCLKGKQHLYAYCEKHGIPFRRCGKFIVATTPAEEKQLESIYQKGFDNGVLDLEFRSGKELSKLEPALNAIAGIWSPSTGIISTHDLMTSFLGEVEAGGGMLATHAEVTSVVPDKTGFLIRVAMEGKETYELHSRVVINSAGLGAQSLSQCIEGLDSALTPPLFFCRGNYFSLSGLQPFSHLIYPVPDPSGAGLGVHATIDLGGQIKFGPDVDYIETEDYRVNLERQAECYDAIRRYYPGLPDNSLVPAYAGIRPKTSGPGEAVQDFMILGEDEQKIPGLIQLFGIESPGLTSSLAIAERVRNMTKDMLA